MDEPRDKAMTLAELAENSRDEERESGRDDDAVSHSINGSFHEIRYNFDDHPNNGESQEVAETSISVHESISSENTENNLHQLLLAQSHITELENVREDREEDEASHDFNRGYNTNPHTLEDNVDNLNRLSFTPLARSIPPLVDIGMPDDIPDIFWDDDVDDFVIVSNRAREIAESLPYVRADSEDSSPVDIPNQQSEATTETSNQMLDQGPRVHPVRQNLANSMRQYGYILSLEQIDQFGQGNTANFHEDPDNRNHTEEAGRQSHSCDRVVSPVAVDRVEEYHCQESPSSYARPRHEVGFDSLGAGIQDESMSNNVLMDGSNIRESENNPASDIFETCNNKDVNADTKYEQGQSKGGSPSSSLSDTDATTSEDSSPSESVVVHSASAVDVLKKVLEEIIPAQSNPSCGWEKGEATKTPHPSLYSETAEGAPSSENTIDDEGDADVENVADAEFDFQSVSPACPETVVIARERTDADADALLNRVINEEPDDCLMANGYGFKSISNGSNSNRRAAITDSNETTETDKPPNVENCDVSLHNLCAVESSKVTKVDVLNELEGTLKGDNLKIKETSDWRPHIYVMKENYNSVITKRASFPSIVIDTTKAVEKQITVEVVQQSPAHAAEATVDYESVGQTDPQDRNICETTKLPVANVSGNSYTLTDIFEIEEKHSNMANNPRDLNNVDDQESKKIIESFETCQRPQVIDNSIPNCDSTFSSESPRKMNPRHCNDNTDFKIGIGKVGDKFVREKPDDHRVDCQNSGDGQGNKSPHAKSNLNASRVILEATDLWMAEGEKKQTIKETRRPRLKSIVAKVPQMVVGSSERPFRDRYYPCQSSSPKSQFKSGRINVSYHEQAIRVPQKFQDDGSLEKSTTNAKTNSSRFSRSGSIEFRRILGSVKNKAVTAPSSTTYSRETGLQSCSRAKAPTFPTVKLRPQKMSKNTGKQSKDSDCRCIPQIPENCPCASQIPENLINHGVHQPQNHSVMEAGSAEDNSLSRCPARRCTPNDSDVSENKKDFLRKLNNSGYDCGNESCFGKEISSTTVSSLFSTLSASFREANYQKGRYEQEETLPPCPANQRMTLNSTMFGPTGQKSRVEPYKLYIPKKHLKPAETSAEEYHRYKMDLRMYENLSKVRPSVDCHMDPRLIKKRPCSKDREKFLQKARDSSLLTMENVNFMEVLKYKRPKYRQLEQINGCKSTTVTQRRIKGRQMDKSAENTCAIAAVGNGPLPGASLKSKIMDSKGQKLPVWKPTKSRV